MYSAVVVDLTATGGGTAFTSADLTMNKDCGLVATTGGGPYVPIGNDTNGDQIQGRGDSIINVRRLNQLGTVLCG